MADLQQWKVTFQSQTLQLANLQLNHLIPFEVKSQSYEEIRAIIPQMGSVKIKEAKSISNYFPIVILPSFINTILNLSKVLHFQNIDSLERLKSLLLKCGVGAHGLGEQVKTRRAQLSMCFSRRWREPQTTIYILMHNYLSQRIMKTRAYILNQRGLILQTFSNLDSANYASTLSKFIMNHYGRAQRIILVGPEAKMADLDSFYIFRECEQHPNVILVNYKTKQSLNLLNKQRQINHIQFSVVNQNNGLVLAKYQKQQLLIWHNQSVGYGEIKQHLQLIHQIVTREAYISQLFLAYDYNSDHFSQKQLLLRLFSFYFNFASLQNLELDNLLMLHQRFMNSVADELQKRLQEDESKFDQEQAHTFTSNARALYCPVCNKRSKIICKKCCMEFNRSFALCETKCFQFFHKDRFSFETSLQHYKKYRNYEIAERGNNQIQKDNLSSKKSKDQSKKESNLLSDLASMAQVPSYLDLKQKWAKNMKSLSKQLNLFNNNCGIGLISQSVLHKINYVHEKGSDYSLTDQRLYMIKLEDHE